MDEDSLCYKRTAGKLLDEVGEHVVDLVQAAGEGSHLLARGGELGAPDERGAKLVGGPGRRVLHIPTITRG